MTHHTINYVQGGMKGRQSPQTTATSHTHNLRQYIGQKSLYLVHHHTASTPPGITALHPPPPGWSAGTPH